MKGYGMISSALTAEDTGLEVVDLRRDNAFLGRQLHTRSIHLQMEAMRRLSRAFVDDPDNILQELVEVAIDLCGAESAGISVEQENATDERCYEWIATAGIYSPFLRASLPRYPSACTICLERGTPQQLRVSKRFFDLMGIEAALVTDGLLLPWEVDGTRGTIWILAHGRREAFDSEDLRMMQTLADFAAIAIRHRRQQNALLGHATAAAASAMANELAHQINNPLQSLTNLVYMAETNQSEGDATTLAARLSPQLDRLSVLVARLLALQRHSA